MARDRVVFEVPLDGLKEDAKRLQESREQIHKQRLEAEAKSKRIADEGRGALARFRALRRRLRSGLARLRGLRGRR